MKKIMITLIAVLTAAVLALNIGCKRLMNIQISRRNIAVNRINTDISTLIADGEADADSIIASNTGKWKAEYGDDMPEDIRFIPIRNENGECVAFVTGNCPSSFNRNATNDTTFYAKDNGICPAESVNYTYGDNLHFIFNGLILSSAPTVCATGHYIDGTCGAYSSTGCITGYVDAGTDGVISAVDANGSCQSNYDFLGSYQSCTAETTDNLCTTLCNGDMSHTAAGQCAAACTAGFSKLKTDTGLSFTAWGTRTTHPSIVVETDDGRCYVNLAPGRATNAVNVQYNNTVYHTTE